MKIIDKNTFTLAFAALLVSLVSIDQNYYNISFLFYEIKFFNFTLSILDLIFLDFLLLMLSIYIYALNSARYGMSKIEGLKLFNYLLSLANYLYFAAIIAPFITILFLILYFVLTKIIEYTNWTYLNYLLHMLSTIVSLFYIYSTNKGVNLEDKHRLINLNNDLSAFVSEANTLLKNKNWYTSTITLYELINLILKEQAYKIGSDIKDYSFNSLIDILRKQNLLSSKQYLNLNLIKNIRDKLVHSTRKITNKDIELMIEVANDLFLNVDKNFKIVINKKKF